MQDSLALNIEFTSILLLLANFLFSYRGFNRLDWQEKYLFEVDRVLIGKEYYRLLSAGFLHTGWPHLVFNMFALYLFAKPLDAMGVSPLVFILIYFGALLGGNALSLYFHRNHGNYRAVGASGAVNGIIFASIAMWPSLKVWFIPGWLFGILYMAVTIYGIRSQRDNVGHEAHLGGALIGLVLAIIFFPELLGRYPLILAGLLVPPVVFLFIVVRHPHLLLVPLKGMRPNTPRVREPVIIHKSAAQKPAFQSPEEEIDHLLDKGLENLTSKERKRLEELSRKLDD